MRERLPYPPSALLPGVCYPGSEDAIFGDPVLDLEYTTLRNLENLADAIKTALIEEGMIQIPELLVAHCCGYLGYLSVYTMGLKRATVLQQPLMELIESQAGEAFALFGKYPVNSGETQQRRDHLEQCRSEAPGSIIVQTVRFGRHLFDIMDELGIERDFRSDKPTKQTELFCPIDDMMAIFRTHAHNLKKARKREGEDITLDINQTAIQIGYLIGYYGHLDDTLQRYVEYGLPCIPMFIEYGHKFIKVGL